MVQGLVLSETWVLGLVALDLHVTGTAGNADVRRAVLIQNCLLWAPLMVVVGSVIASREREEAAKNLARTEATEAQTRLLQSQLHPHVLFNSLNGLLELVHKDPHAAESCIRNMSDLLHTLLRDRKSVV